MKFLVIDGWTREGNLDHGRAGCILQRAVFEELIAECMPGADITTVDTHEAHGTAGLELDGFDAAIWTGGGGNIYQADDFNRRQLDLCERVLDRVPYLWGSCWGMQVVVTALGGKVAPSRRPEIGIAKDIVTRPSGITDALYATKAGPFDAPAHHFDEVEHLPGVFDIVAENSVTMQAIASRDGKIFCTQYHPEAPYDFVGRLLRYWAPNYASLFDAPAFEALLALLPEKERAEESFRKIEFENWLGYVRDGGRAAGEPAG